MKPYPIESFRCLSNPSNELHDESFGVRGSPLKSEALSISDPFPKFSCSFPIWFPSQSQHVCATASFSVAQNDPKVSAPIGSSARGSGIEEALLPRRYARLALGEQEAELVMVRILC